jgi:hypothetical protein
MGMEMNNIDIEKEKRPYPPRCTELLERFKSKEALPMGEKLQFSGVDGQDVYNITAPFFIDNRTVIAGRVEKREKLADSQVMFFEEKNGVWSPIDGAPTFKLEDGFLKQIGDETIFGGVEVYPSPGKDNKDEVGYRTVFYRGHDLSSLEKFAVGPDGMKDIRLVSLANGHIGVFTRPQGGENGNGKIGYIEIESPEDLNEKNLLNAKIIENQFASGEWGGVNELYLLEDGKIGVVGHIAYIDEQDIKHYYAMAFVYDPETHLSSPIEIIATRENFPAGEEKNTELADIIFPSSLVFGDDGTVTLYAGLSDAEAGINSGLPNPFKGKILFK